MQTRSPPSTFGEVGKNKTRLNIETPTKIQYYFITAHDFAQNESGASNVAVFKPAPAIADSRSLRIDSPE